MTGIDWRGLMRIGFVGLKLKPADFWALTPAELAVMTATGDAERPLGRARLNELVAQFPDELNVRTDDG